MIVGFAVGLFWCACFFLIVECCCLLVIAILCEFVGFGWCGAFAHGGLYDIGFIGLGNLLFDAGGFGVVVFDALWGLAWYGWLISYVLVCVL